MTSDLLSDVERFLTENGMGEFNFGLLAAGNGRLVERLRSTTKKGLPSRVWPETEVKIRVFMASHKKEKAA